MTNLSRSLIIGCSALALAACGPEDIVSPGVNGDINIGDIDNSVNNGTTTSGGGAGGGTVSQAAAGCPTIGSDQVIDSGVIGNATVGTWRVCQLPAVFTADANLSYAPGVLYSMNGRVDVGTDDGPTADATDGITGTNVDLSIEPGVIIYGATGRSYLVVQRGSTIDAVGSAAMPIIFTSRDNVLGLSSNTSSQQWGGVVLLGRAPVSDCSSGTPNPADPLDCQQELEGALNPPSFGGNTPGDSSGSLEYVQLRFSGFTLDSGSELQSLTTGGVGSGTTISHIQSYNSSDDGVELFGGSPKLDHFIVVGAEDDSFDIDTGAKADIQYAIAVQRAGAGDNAIEIDSPDGDYDFTALPRTNARFTNFTFIAQGSGSQALRVRGQADLNMSNGIVVKAGNCARIDEEANPPANPADDAGPPVFNSVLFDCTLGTGGSNTDIAAYLAAGNDTAYTSALTGLFINSAAEDAYAPVFDATAVSTFFAAATTVGAAASGSTWWQGWTCDSATVSFNSGRSCLTLPLYS